jgi:hypothetical protein
VRQVLLPAQQRLPRQVVAPLLHRQHGPLLPVVRLPELGVRLVAQPLLVGDGRRHLLLGARQLVAHVQQDLVQHLLGVFRRGDEVVEVGLDEGGEAVEDAHGQ